MEIGILQKKEDFVYYIFRGLWVLILHSLLAKFPFFSVAFHRIQNLGGNGGVKDW